MANLTDDLNYADADRGTWPTQLTNGLQVFKGSLVGIDANGRIVKWADTAGYQFRGLVQKGVTGDTTASVPPEAEVDERGRVLKRVTVTGASAQADLPDLVYAGTDNPADLTKTATLNVGAIGEIVRWHNATICDVRFFTPSEFRNQ